MTQKTRKAGMSHRLAAAMTVGVMATGAAAPAFAGVLGGTSDMYNLTNNITSASNRFTQLMTLLGYVGGSGFAIAGIYKLKLHVDNPGNTPLKDGLMRLAAGGALLSLPFIIRVIQGSVNNGDAGSNAIVGITTFTAAGG